MREFLSSIIQINESLSITIFLFVVLCVLFGYRNRSLVSVVCGFILGFVMIGTLASSFISNIYILTALSITAGLPVAYVTYRFKVIRYVVLCSTLLIFTDVLYLFDVKLYVWLIIVAVGIILGIIALKYTRFIIIIVTSITCGFMIVRIILTYFEYPVVTFYVILGAIISFAAILFQYGYSKGD